MSIDEHWRDQWVVLGGGSRGLGLAIAQRLAAGKAKLAILGRDLQQLDYVRSTLLTNGALAVETFAVDLSKTPLSEDSEVARFQKFCSETAIKLCVAAVGKSDRGFLQSVTASELQDAIATNVVSSLQLAQWASSSLQRANGQLVFIASLAGVAVPGGMGTYSISKAAQVAMVRQFRRENPAIGVTLVCTGPIRRLDAGNRYEEITSNRELPEHLNAPGGGVRMKALDPNQLAERILIDAAERKSEIIIPWKVRLLLAISAFFPVWADRLVAGSFAKDRN